MRKVYYLIAAALMFNVLACKTAKPIPPTPPPTQNTPSVVIEEKTVPEIKISTPKKEASQDSVVYTLPTYQASYTRRHDLIHTKLDVRFDWAKQRVIGKATLTLKPYFYDSDVLVLDAKNFDFNKITFDGKNEPLKYVYDGNLLTIQLGRLYKPTEEYKIFIDYVAKPEERVTGGSAAISSDKGLFFINPKGDDISKPMQIWTQGETESNSCWFPTIDKPNERCTQEIYITTEDKYKTLSNGLLKTSKKNTDGTRTDYWVMDKPHPPYLFMLAVGDFAIVKDKWNDIELMYYVEPNYEKDAKAIFPYTPEMLSFFSNKLGYKYPWQKYAQIIIRDYVSGAMENTTAVTFQESFQKHQRELIDGRQNESVVAHEMFHHWFGDLVTCESWSNLTLNEGFANYSEYLWLQHKHGDDEMDYHRLNELQGYLGQAHMGAHDLINFQYKSREDMFDAHSYNKGGLILHMLRNYLGDDAFFKSLNYYLTKNANTDVEAHELRMAFEDVTGEDLNWFFNQWFYSSGHPVIEVTKNYNEATKKLSVTFEQKQDPTKTPPIFQLPIAIDIYTANGQMPVRQKIRTIERKQTFTFDVPAKPLLVDVDGDKVILAEFSYKKTDEEYAFQYYNVPKFLARFSALQNLVQKKTDTTAKLFKDALNDKFWAIREAATGLVDATEPEVGEKLAILAEKDQNSQVRAAALQMLTATKDKKYADLAKRILEKEQAYPPLGNALMLLNETDKVNAATYVQKLEKEGDSNIISIISDIYSESPSAEKIAFFERNFNKVDEMPAVSFYENYLNMATQLDEKTTAHAIENLKKTALSDSSAWRRYGSTKSINNLREQYSADEKKDKAEILMKILQEIKSKEQMKSLKEAYDGMF